MMPKILIAIICTIAIAGFSGCGGQVEGENGPESTLVAENGTPEIAESPTPPPTPRPTPTPLPPAQVVNEPTPTIPATPEPTTTPEPTPTPTPTPVPPPTPTPPRFQAVQPPAPVAGSIFKFTRGPTIDDNVLTLSGYITNRSDLVKAKWTIQVWQAEYPVDLHSDCSTEKPVGFIMEPSGSGSTYVPAATPHEYFYCIQGQGQHRTVNVPWVMATEWSLKERGGRESIYDPFYWDFSMRADLNDERIYDLEYRRPEGWTVMIWAGDTLIAREWVGF